MRDLDSFAARFERAHPKLESLEFLGCGAFEARWCEVRVTDLVAVAFERPPMVVERREVEAFTLWFPTRGSALVQSGGITRQVGAGIGFALDTHRHRLVRGDDTAGVLFTLDRNRLARTREAMRGGSAPDPAWSEREELRFIAADDPAYPLALFCESMFGVLDAIAHKPALADRIAVEDGFYRMLAWILSSPADRGETPQRRSQTGRRHLQELCDFIDQNLTDRLTLTELESVSELSARVLQLHFRKHFGMTPMEWVRNRRLDIARTRLLGDPEIMITTLSYELGFSSPSHFAAYYQRRFGELPSRVRRGELRD